MLVKPLLLIAVVFLLFANSRMLLLNICALEVVDIAAGWKLMTASHTIYDLLFLRG